MTKFANTFLSFPTLLGKVISIDDFDLIRVIGRGSYAKVLMVELKKTKRLYAMKVIKKELVTDDEVRTTVPHTTTSTTYYKYHH